MARSAREIHLAAQRRHPVGYWVLGGMMVASLGLAVIDHRLGFFVMMLGMACGGVFSRWGAEGQ